MAHHRLTDVNLEAMQATCAVCGPDTPIYVRGKSPVRRECLSQRQAWARSAASKRGRRERNLRLRYGITIDQYDALAAAQSGACALCDKAPEYRLVVDHCHETGRVRGLLCHNCNILLAKLGDDRARRLSSYLG